jgi:hypothetical protein
MENEREKNKEKENGKTEKGKEERKNVIQVKKERKQAKKLQRNPSTQDQEDN